MSKFNEFNKDLKGLTDFFIRNDIPVQITIEFGKIRVNSLISNDIHTVESKDLTNALSLMKDKIDEMVSYG